ncbi:hypothetical protein GJU39_10850 [Pedobacter petrophilus]|uniref:Uncharacterized protein n=1 Tax=Pedobacter petrophilus TaxID=1908241 RepID=A0A7K0FZH1_9SPHI|nr:hypothetical protein [Pedobacter petrophilus]MRX76590.1 hypothetical protein [Pedobacter petrophilus]
MHEIEDLVEETTYLVDRSSNDELITKRDLLFNLYRLEAFFDTSYTHFRVMDILLRNRFVYQIPIAKYPQLGITDEQLPTDDDGDWVYAQDEKEMCYAQSGNGVMYLYCDAGDWFWKRLCELDILPKADHKSPQQLSMLQLVKVMMLEAERQHRNDLLKQWYNLLANGILEGDFAEDEGVPGTFEGFSQDEDFTEIRDIALRNQLMKQKMGSEMEGYLLLPHLKSNLDSATGLEEIYKIRYLLEFSKSIDQLRKAYRKDQQALETGPEKIKIVQPFINDYLVRIGWNYVGMEPENTWLWYQDLNDEQYEGPGHRLFIQLKLDADESTLFCNLALQHSLILKWQEKQPSFLPKDWHFYYDLSGWLSGDFTNKNKHLGSWGSWKFDLKSSEKILKSHLENLIEGLKQADYFRFVLAEFPEKFLAQDAQRILYLLDEGEDGTGTIPKYVLFDSKITTLIAFAKWAAEKKDVQQAEKIMNQIKEIVETMSVSALQKEVIFDPLLQLWYEKKAMMFPPVWHLYLVNSLRKK